MKIQLTLLTIILLALAACKKEELRTAHYRGRVLDYATREPLDSVRLLMSFGFDAGSSTGVLGTPSKSKNNYKEVIAYTNSNGEFDLFLDDVEYTNLSYRLEGYLSSGSTFEKEKYNASEGIDPITPLGKFDNVELYMTPQIKVKTTFTSNKHNLKEDIVYSSYTIISHFPDGSEWGGCRDCPLNNSDSIPNSLSSYGTGKMPSDSKCNISFEGRKKNGDVISYSTSFDLKGKKDYHFIVDIDK